MELLTRNSLQCALLCAYSIMWLCAGRAHTYTHALMYAHFSAPHIYICVGIGRTCCGMAHLHSSMELTACSLLASTSDE